jgi:hypothetical protein
MRLGHYFRKSTADCACATGVLLVYLVYPSLVRSAFNTLECVMVCGSPRLQQDLLETCWENRHLDIIMYLSLPCIMLFAVVLPFGSMFKLYHDQHKLYDNRKHSFRYGMLYSGYRESRWYWEIVVWMRKLAMIGVVTFGRAWVRQLHLALGVMVIALHLQHYGSPFDLHTADGRRLQSVEISSLMVLIFMLWAAVFFTFVDGEGEGEDDPQTQGGQLTTNVMAIMLILTNVVFVAWNLWLAMVAFNKKEQVVAKMVKGLKAVQTRTSQISTMWKRSTHSGASSRSTKDSGKLSGLTELDSLEANALEMETVYGKGETKREGNTGTVQNPMTLDRSGRRGVMLASGQIKQQDGGQRKEIELTIITDNLGSPRRGSFPEGERKEDDVDDFVWDGGELRVYDMGEDRWIVVFDEETGHDYYYSESTGESTWTAPWE